VIESSISIQNSLEEQARMVRAPHSPPLLGAHVDGARVRFGLWAPHARAVSVIGDFNGWDPRHTPMHPDGAGGWHAEAPARHGDRYKFHIEGPGGHRFDRADPRALYGELPPGTASRVWALDHDWHDASWMARRMRRNALDAPISIYEVHLGSWQRADDGTFLNYRELGRRLAEHARTMGFTHVELMPVTEHPFYGSWGYQTTGYFAPTARYGTPQDLMALVDTLHQAEIGVILDWVPSHFPDDWHGLARFDGTPLYEHPDPRVGYHPQWHSCVFDYGRPQVRDFLIESALFWLEHYHFDGLRVDAVASMLYLDFARGPGQWLPNEHGGHENLAAVRFMQELNTRVYAAFPDVQLYAEESSSWPKVSRPVYEGGLGFGLKWNMGWMNDTLRYFSRPHFYRAYHEGDIKFSLVYAFHENFLLPLSHDEVVHGKGSLLGRQPGDDWQRFAGLRALYGYMWAHPGKKLLFMGGEWGQPGEWHHERALDWHLFEHPLHAGVARWVADLNRCLHREPALHRADASGAGFEWAPVREHRPTVLAFFRHDGAGGPPLLALVNLTPELIPQWQVGVPHPGVWHEVLNSDSHFYGGSGVGNFGSVQARPDPCTGAPYCLTLMVPPLAAVYLQFGGSP